MRKSRHRPAPSPKPKPRAPVTIHQLSRDALRSRLRQLEYQLKQDAVITVEDAKELSQQAEKIRAELLHRHHTNKRILIIALLTLTLGALCFALFALNNKANIAEENLSRAISTNNPQLVAEEVKRAKQGLNSYINPSLRRAIREAQAYVDSQQHMLNQSCSLLQAIEGGSRTWESLGAEEIRLIHTPSFQHTPEGLAVLRRWRQLIEQRKAQKITLRSDSLRAIMKALPPHATLSRNPTESLLAVQEETELLRERLDEFLLLQRIHQLDHRHANRIRARLQELRLLKREINALIDMDQQLLKAEEYEDFLLRLRCYQANSYPLGISTAELSSQLPRENMLRGIIGLGRVRLNPSELQSLKAILEGKAPTFTHQHPANMLQVSLMESIFQSRPLHQRYYRLSNPALGETWLIQTKPKLNEKNQLEVTLDELDARSQAGHSGTLLIQPSPQLRLEELSYAHVIKELKLTREDFFLTSNLAKTLEQLLSYKSGSISSLYKARIFKTLVQVITTHSKPLQVGLPLSPLLRRDIESFTALEGQAGITLSDTSWLNSDPKHQRAEKLFDQWFSERVGRQYLMEMSRMLRLYLHHEPEYIGYITSSGTAHFHHKVAQTDHLWFIGAQDMQLKVGGLDALAEAHPFSPIFRTEPPKKIHR